MIDYGSYCSNDGFHITIKGDRDDFDYYLGVMAVLTTTDITEEIDEDEMGSEFRVDNIGFNADIFSEN